MQTLLRQSLWLKVALFTMIATTSIPLGVLQLGVWASMFDEFYDQTQSVSLSAEWTLDGNNRCSGCELVTDLGSETHESIRTYQSLALDTKLLNESSLPVIIEQPILLGRLYFQHEKFPIAWTQVEIPPPRAQREFI
ncbi:hypothetical protein N8920_03095 [Opitutales bacterium]|nr:hypothetical protein [Opitutales bacterium]